jgi:hypothetical protein
MNAQEASSEVVERWMVPVEKKVEEEEVRDSKANRNKHIERILIRTIIKNRNTNFIINDEFLKNLLSSSDTNHTESQFVTLHRSGSITLASFDGYNSSSSLQSRHQGTGSGPQERQESSEVFVERVRIKRNDYLNWTSLKKGKRQLTNNIACLVNRLQATMIQPMDIYFGNMAIIRSEIDLIQQVDLFSHLSQALQKPSGKGTKDINWSTMTENYSRIEAKIDSVQVDY